MVTSVPRIGQNEKIGTDQPQASVRQRLVDHNLRVSRIQYTAADKGCIDIVEPHCSLVRAAYAPELRGIPLRLSYCHILKALSGVSNGLHKGACPGLLFRCDGFMFV